MSSSPLNILFLPKWYPHEADPFDGNFIENYAHAIKRIANLTVLFVHSDPRNDEDFRFEETDNEGIREMRVFFKKARSPIAPLNRVINLLRYIKAQRLGYQRLFQEKAPDLVHVHVLARSSFLALHLLKKRIPFVISEHWSGYLPESAALKNSGKSVFYRMIGKKAKGIHTVTNHLAVAMRNHGIDNHYHVIPNVVKEDLFRPMAAEESEKIKILYVGNILQSPKRIFDTIKAFAEIKLKRQDFQLDIYGEGNELDKMQALITKLKLDQHIFYCGTTDRAGIAMEMAKADFLFLNSEFENQPCVINESLCCGTAVVVPNIEGILEFMDDDFGLTFQRSDEDAFISSILQMMDTHEDYKKELIRDKAIKRFGEEAIAQEFLSFYQKAIKE